MYNLNKYIENIIEKLTSIERYIELSNKAGRFDANKHAEEFYRDLLNLFFDWNLKPLNTETTPNYPGVDLGDGERWIAVQVTSENTTTKIHDSIEGFKNKSLREGYKELYILMFKGKQEFLKVDFSARVNNTFLFDKSKHIIDHGDLCAKLPQMNIDKIKLIADCLDKHTQLDYDSIDKGNDDLGIINEIFEYIKEHKPKQATDINKITDSSQINLLPKIRLNFPQEQQARVNRLIQTVWDKMQLVKTFIEKQDDEVSINELICTIREDFCILRDSHNTEASIDDITTIIKLSEKYLPERNKRNPAYMANAKALVFHCFEFCYIGKKTINSSGSQLMLSFD